MRIFEMPPFSNRRLQYDAGNVTYAGSQDGTGGIKYGGSSAHCMGDGFVNRGEGGCWATVEFYSLKIADTVRGEGEG